MNNINFAVRALIIGLMMLFVGCASVKKDWETSLEVNTIESYGQYISKHPKSKYTASAKNMIKKLQREEKERALPSEWEKIKEKDNVATYMKFINKNYLSAYAKKAKDRVVKIIRENWALLPKDETKLLNMYLDQVKSMYAEYAGNDIFQASTKNGLTYQGNYQGVIYTSSHGLLYIRSAKFIEGKTGDVLGEVCGFEGNFYKK